MTRNEAIGVLALMREQAYERGSGGAIAECALGMAIQALQVGSHGNPPLSETSGSAQSEAQAQTPNASEIAFTAGWDAALRHTLMGCSVETLHQRYADEMQAFQATDR